MTELHPDYDPSWATYWSPWHFQYTQENHDIHPK